MYDPDLPAAVGFSVADAPDLTATPPELRELEGVERSGSSSSGVGSGGSAGSGGSSKADLRAGGSSGTSSCGGSGGSGGGMSYGAAQPPPQPPPPPEPLVFRGGQPPLRSGCSGLILSPLTDGGQDQLPAAAVAALARVALGQDRFSTLELQGTAGRLLLPPPTPPNDYANVVPGGNGVGAGGSVKAVKSVDGGGGKSVWGGRSVAGGSAGGEAASWVPARVQALPSALRPAPHTSHSRRPPRQPPPPPPPRPAAPTLSTPGVNSPTHSALSAAVTPPQPPPAGHSNAADDAGLRSIPIFEIGPDFALLPGQYTKLRVFEKRYQLLFKTLIETGGCFAFPIERELGITASVRKCVDGMGRGGEKEGTRNRTVWGGVWGVVGGVDKAVCKCVNGAGRGGREEQAVCTCDQCWAGHTRFITRQSPLCNPPGALACSR